MADVLGRDRHACPPCRRRCRSARPAATSSSPAASGACPSLTSCSSSSAYSTSAGARSMLRGAGGGRGAAGVVGFLLGHVGSGVSRRSGRVFETCTAVASVDRDDSHDVGLDGPVVTRARVRSRRLDPTYEAVAVPRLRFSLRRFSQSSPLLGSPSGARQRLLQPRDRVFGSRGIRFGVPVAVVVLRLLLADFAQRRRSRRRSRPGCSTRTSVTSWSCTSSGCFAFFSAASNAALANACAPGVARAGRAAWTSAEVLERRRPRRASAGRGRLRPLGRLVVRIVVLVRRRPG